MSAYVKDFAARLRGSSMHDARCTLAQRDVAIEGKGVNLVDHASALGHVTSANAVQRLEIGCSTDFNETNFMVRRCMASVMASPGRFRSEWDDASRAIAIADFNFHVVTLQGGEEGL